MRVLSREGHAQREPQHHLPDQQGGMYMVEPSSFCTVQQAIQEEQVETSLSTSGDTIGSAGSVH